MSFQPSLPRHAAGLPSNFVPLAKRTKHLPTEGHSGYPSRAPGLPKDYLGPSNDIAASPGYVVNGRVQCRLLSRTRDQKYVNRYQFVFVDTIRDNRPVMLSLPQVNRLLVEDYTVRNMKLADFLDRFKLYSVVANNDIDLEDEIPTDRLGRSVTLTAWGATFTYDYWSHRDRMLRPYDNCFFVMKKMRLPTFYPFQTDMSVSMPNVGQHVDADSSGQFVWQIIPYATSNNSIPPEVYTTYDPENEISYTGMFWSVGNAHEYAQISSKDKMSVRVSPTDVARDITLLHMNGQVPIIQFYAKILQPKIILGSDESEHNVPNVPALGSQGKPTIDWSQIVSAQSIAQKSQATGYRSKMSMTKNSTVPDKPSRYK